jgi:hypothetical protein
MPWTHLVQRQRRQRKRDRLQQFSRKKRYSVVVSGGLLIFQSPCLSRVLLHNSEEDIRGLTSPDDASINVADNGDSNAGGSC